MIVEVGKIDWYDVLSKYGLVPESKKNKRKKQTHRILNVYSAFDIETSTVWMSKKHTDYNVHSFMYIWQFQIEDMTVLGRTWEEYFAFLKVLRNAIDRIRKDNELSVNPLLIIWDHNLAYEWTWLSGLYPFTNDEVFFRDIRKPIYCRMYDTFEYRCSYLQTNLSLAKLCEQTGVEMKLSGQKFDYNKVRYPWTKLTDFELEYCIRDVESLVKAMKYRIQRGGDTLETVPLTSTGYVRRECKEAVCTNYLAFCDIKPKRNEYKLLRDAFRGGNTHASRYMVGRIISDVYSYDISSSYPTQQLTKDFPMHQFRWLNFEYKEPAERLEFIFKFMGANYAVVGRYQFTNIRLKDPEEAMPYISLSKCKATSIVIDNGRILEAGYMEIALTEIDLEIVFDQYTFDLMNVIECMVSAKEPLPDAYKEVIRNYYRDKTALKGDDSEDGQYNYTKSKNMLNSIYGMSATDPIHQEVIYKDGEYTKTDYDNMTAEQIDKKLRTAAFPYSWGVYTTAYARLQLHKAIKLCGKQIIYCDTDSVKTKGPVPIHKLNDVLKKAAIRNRAFADDMNGERHYIGLFEQDAHYEKFITQGSKRYAFIKNGKLGVTVSGVTREINEETGVPFAAEELGCLENFHPAVYDKNGKVISKAMVWRRAAGTMAVYNDIDDFDYTDPETGKTVHITKNVSIIPSTYVMTHSRDYRKLLDGSVKLYGVYQKERK